MSAETVDPTVIVQLSETREQHVDLMLQACTAALRRGRCTLAPADTAPPTEAVAVVSWQGADGVAAVIEVALTAEGPPKWVSRRIEFQPADPRRDRWRAVGLTIATLVGDLSDETAVRPDPGPAPAPDGSPPARAETNAQAPGPAKDGASTRPQPTSAAAEPSDRAGEQGARHRAWRLAAGALLDPAITSDHPRLGGWVRGVWLPWFPVYATVGGVFAVRPRDEGILWTWWGGSAGAGLVWLPHQDALEMGVRLEGVLTRVTVSVDDSASDASDAVLLAGVRGGLELVWPAAGTLGVLGAVEAEYYSRGVEVLLEGDRAAVYPASTYTVLLGARFCP